MAQAPTLYRAKPRSFKTHRHEKSVLGSLILMRLYIFDGLRYSFRQHGIRVHELSKLKSRETCMAHPQRFISQNDGILKHTGTIKCAGWFDINAAVYI